MIAQVCGLKPGEFVHTFGDVHLYNDHIEQAKLQLTLSSLSAKSLFLATSLLNNQVARKNKHYQPTCQEQALIFLMMQQVLA